MLPTRSIKHPPQRKNRSYGRKPATMTRSGSILSTIRNIVTAPLSWFASNDEFDDINGKRRRTVASVIDSLPEPELEGSKPKKQRVDSPSRDSGYLDPPIASFQPSYLPPQRKDLTLKVQGRENGQTSRSSVTRGAAPLSETRTMSIDPPTRNATLTRDSAATLTHGSSMGMKHSLSMPRDLSMHPPTPFRMRTSLTPQPSPTKPTRREASAPPPLASLMTNPIFVKAPPELLLAPKLDEQKTMSLGSLADFHRPALSPSRDLSFNNPISAPSFVSQIPHYNNVRVTNVAEKTLHELDVYKSPIVPSRYKDAKVIPQFLKPRRSHVPIPMPTKGREIKPSLGMPAKGKDAERGGGKPYAGRGGLSKLLARRRAEEEEERAVTLMDDENTSTKGTKKDVGISAKLVSDSDEDRPRIFDSNVVPPLPPVDAGSAPLYSGREQLSGRVGRTRTSRRDPGWRSVPLNGRERNKFSAAFDDDESMDLTDGADISDAKARDGSSTAKDQVEKVNTFEAPAGFSFAKNTTPIEHEHAGAKEPPIASLPFSFGPSTTTSKQAETSQVPSFFSPKPVSQPTQSSGGSVFGNSSAFPSASTSSIAMESPNTMTSAPDTPAQPQLTVVPPTPEQRPTAHSTDATSTTQTGASVSNDGSASGSASIPNFFAKPTFPANEPAMQPPLATTTSPAPTLPAPVKDVENPFWDGDKKSDTSNISTFPTHTVERPRSTEPKPLPFGGFNKPSSLAQPFSLSGNGATPTSLFGAPAAITSSTSAVGGSTKSTESSMTSQSPFSFGAEAQPNAGKPSILLGTGEEKPLNSSVFSFGKPDASQVSAPTPDAESSKLPSPSLFGSASASNPPPAELPKPAFSFGTPPPTADGKSSLLTDPNAPKPLFGSKSSGFSFPAAPTSGNADTNKSPFAFGAPPSTPPAVPERKDAFPTFGAPSSTNSAFSFGTSTSNSEANAGTVPFAFSTPARPSTPSRQDDKEIRMEESPTRDENGKVASDNKPTQGFSFAATNSSPFGQNSGGSGMFSFGAPSPAPTTFAEKPEVKAPGFSGFTRTASAPVVSTTGFSFGQKGQEEKPPASASAFGSQPNPFGQSSASSISFGFGATPSTNPFGQPAPPNTSAPDSPSHFSQNPPFSFGAPSSAPNNPFNFGASQPSSPSTSASGLPQSPATSNSSFAFGQPSGAPQSTSPAVTFGSQTSGGALFNIGAPPPAPSAGSNTQRQVKKLPRRGGAKPR